MFMFAEDDGNEKGELSEGALDEVLDEDADDEDDDLGLPEGEEEGRDWA